MQITVSDLQRKRGHFVNSYQMQFPILSFTGKPFYYLLGNVDILLIILDILYSISDILYNLLDILYNILDI